MSCQNIQLMPYLEAKVLDKVGDTGLVLGLEASTGVDDKGDRGSGGALVKGSNLDAVAGLGDGGGVTGLEDGGDQVQGLAGGGDGQHYGLQECQDEKKRVVCLVGLSV